MGRLVVTLVLIRWYSFGFYAYNSPHEIATIAGILDKRSQSDTLGQVILAEGHYIACQYLLVGVAAKHIGYTPGT
jgi:hypothetical protein